MRKIDIEHSGFSTEVHNEERGLHVTVAGICDFYDTYCNVELKISVNNINVEFTVPLYGKVRQVALLVFGRNWDA